MARDIHKEAGPITHDEAEQLALACIDAAFNNAPRADGRRFRASIPVNPREDTDVRLMAYIKQQRAKEADPPAVTETGLSPTFTQACINCTDEDTPIQRDGLCLRCAENLRGESVMGKQAEAAPQGAPPKCEECGITWGHKAGCPYCVVAAVGDILDH